MIIKKSEIVYRIFFFMLIAASIPYLLYGVRAIQLGYDTVGGLYKSTSIQSGGIGGMFTYLKDILAILLALVVFLKLQVRSLRIFGFVCIIFLIGIVSLFLNGYGVSMFTVAGIRTHIFFLAAMFFCMQHREELSHRLYELLVVTELCCLLHTIVTLLQVISSGSLSYFGGGAYRFSGLFSGSGNLGCYCVAVYLFLMVTKIKYKILSTKLLIINSIQLLFLSFASGTRTCEFLIIIFIGIFLFYEYREKLHISKSIVAITAIICIISIGPKIYNAVIERTARGDLMVSGGGRINLFFDRLNISNAYQFQFGYGLGVGTNASVNMRLFNTQISDSTINLLFTQFGMVGLIIITIAFIYAIYNMFVSNKDYPVLSWSLLIACIVFFFVGNLFEHIAMCIYIVLTYFLIYVQYDDQSIEDE